MKTASEKTIKAYASKFISGKKEILFGNVSKPTVIKYGHGCFYTNKSGDVIDYPNAYAKRGWSNMVYHCAVPSIIVLPYEIIKW